jgi:hypothetical protein
MRSGSQKHNQDGITLEKRLPAAISYVAIKSSHKGSKTLRIAQSWHIYLCESLCFSGFLPAVQDFGRRVWQEKGYMRNCCTTIETKLTKLVHIETGRRTYLIKNKKRAEESPCSY